MASAAEWLREFEADLPEGLALVGENVVTEIISSGKIPIDSGDMRDELKQGVRKTKRGAEIRMRSNVIPYARKQHFKKQRHPIVGKTFVRMVDLNPPGRGSSGARTRYARSYRKAVRQGSLTRVAPRWFDVLKDPMVQRRNATILVNFVRSRRASA